MAESYSEFLEGTEKFVYLHSRSIKKPLESVTCTDEEKRAVERGGELYGLMAEWLGKGLQNLVQRFESASDLTETAL